MWPSMYGWAGGSEIKLESAFFTGICVSRFWDWIACEQAKDRLSFCLVVRTASRNPAFEIPKGSPPLLLIGGSSTHLVFSFYIALNCTNFLEKCLQGLWVQTGGFGGALLLGLWLNIWPFMRHFYTLAY